MKNNDNNTQKLTTGENDSFSESRIYVGTYRKYNEGSIFGAWLKLADFSTKNEFLNACRSLHKDEQDPEFMFQDWENIPQGLIAESWLSDKLFELRDIMAGTENENAFFTWCEYSSYALQTKDVYKIVECFENEFIGEYADEENFAYEIVENNYNLPEFSKTYFDYKAFARDLFCCDYSFCDGFVFAMY